MGIFGLLFDGAFGGRGRGIDFYENHLGFRLSCIKVETVASVEEALFGVEFIGG
jgi:hypothetical protein